MKDNYLCWCSYLMCIMDCLLPIISGRYNLVSKRTEFEYFGYVGSGSYHNGFILLDEDVCMFVILCDIMLM